LTNKTTRNTLHHIDCSSPTSSKGTIYTPTPEQAKKDTRKSPEEPSENIWEHNDPIKQLTKTLYSHDVQEQFNALGYKFTSMAKNVSYKENGRCIASADFIYENATHIMLVETTAELDASHVD
jgi:hypothetical protein